MKLCESYVKALKTKSCYLQNLANLYDKYEEISNQKRVPMGIHVAQPNLNKVKLAYKKKYRFIAAGTDMIFLGNSCKKFLQELSN